MCGAIKVEKKLVANDQRPDLFEQLFDYQVQFWVIKSNTNDCVVTKLNAR
jgi:hypothetical protein